MDAHGWPTPRQGQEAGVMNGNTEKNWSLLVTSPAPPSMVLCSKFHDRCFIYLIFLHLLYFITSHFYLIRLSLSNSDMGLDWLQFKINLKTLKYV